MGAIGLASRSSGRVRRAADPADGEATARDRAAAYDDENLELCARGGRAICWLWLAVTPPFLAVDLARFPADAVPMLRTRIACVAITIALLLVLRTEAGRRWSRWLVFGFGLVGGASTFFMMAQSGGHGSPYFAGIGLVMLGTALVMPWSAAWTWSLCGALIALYLACSAAFFPLGDGRLFANDLLSYVATAMIAGFATVGRSRLRVREFASRWELECSQELLRRQSEAERVARFEAETANATKDEFLATLSHELRTPLNVILGYAEMAQDPALGHDQARELMAALETTSRQLLDMITDTLDISRLHAGHTATQIERVRLRAFWEQLHARCAKLPRRPEVALSWQADVPDVVLRTDPRKLLVMLRNVIGNGLKFTEAGGVRVTAVVEDVALAFRVEDTGIGIPPADRERIFEMFQQLDASDTRRYGGVGLGLYIVRRFADQLGATVRVANAEQRGSVFTIAVPIDASARRAA